MPVVDYIYDFYGKVTEIDCLFSELPKRYELVTSEDTYEVEEPVNWPTVPIVHKRSKQFHGFNYEFMGDSIDLQFGTPHGKDYLMAEYATNGNDGDAVLIWYAEYGGDDYILFEGKIDFNTYKEEGSIVSCMAKRKSMHEKINSRFGTTLKFSELRDLDDNEIPAKTVYGTRLLARTLVETHKNVKRTLEEPDPVTYSNTRDRGIFMFFNSMEPESNTIDGFAGTMAGTSMSNEMQYINYLFAFTANGTYSLKFDAVFKCGARINRNWFNGNDIAGYLLSVHIMHFRGGWESGEDMGAFLKHHYEVYNSGPVPLPGATASFETNSITVSHLIPELEVEVDDRICIFAHLDMFTIPPGRRMNITPTFSHSLFSLEMSGSSELPDTAVASMLIKDALEMSIERTTGLTGVLKSNFYSRSGGDYLVDGCGSNRVVTSGMEIRRTWFGPLQSILQMSFSMKDLYESLDCMDCIGLGYEWDAEDSKELIRIEKREYFYQDVEVFEFKDIFGFSKEVAKDMIYNNLEIGYNKYNEDDVNSLDEAHAYHEYQPPIKTHENKLVLKSKVISSGYLAEITRRQSFATNDKQATTYDDDTFIFHVKYDPGVWGMWFTDFKPITSEPFTDVTGTFSPETTYNMMLTPKRMLMAWGKWLKSFLVYKGGSSVIKNTLTKQNKDLTTTLDPAWPCPNGDEFNLPLKESADVVLASLTESDGVYSPEEVKFSTYLTHNEVRYIINAHRGLSEDDNNYGYCVYLDPKTGDVQKCWLNELSYDRISGKADITALKKKFP